MSTRVTAHHEQHDDKTMFGFWLYLMTDCIIFASLFATYAVLRVGTNGGPGAEEIFDLPFVLIETLILLTSSFTAGLALLAARKNEKANTLHLLMTTGVLGVVFIGMELYEFTKLIAEGNGPTTSGFLTSFFALVGTHGLHIMVGLLWISVLIYLLFNQKLDRNLKRKIALFSLFWHFLDIVWIFIFTIVYMFGASSL